MGKAYVAKTRFKRGPKASKFNKQSSSKSAGMAVGNARRTRG